MTVESSQTSRQYVEAYLEPCQTVDVVLDVRQGS